MTERMSVFELIADLAVLFGKDAYCKHLQSIFMGYLTNTAASVRQMRNPKKCYSSCLVQTRMDYV